MDEIKTKKVLIILSDIDPVLSRVYRNKFQKNEGWIVRITTSYKEAVENIKNEKPDIVLSDIILKQGDGFILLEEIRNSEDKVISSIPIIILTELKQESDRKKALSLGATKYLVKSEVSLLEVIEEVKKMV